MDCPNDNANTEIQDCHTKWGENYINRIAYACGKQQYLVDTHYKLQWCFLCPCGEHILPIVNTCVYDVYVSASKFCFWRKGIIIFVITLTLTSKWLISSNIVRTLHLFSYRTDDVNVMMSCVDFSLPVVICIACEIVSLASHFVTNSLINEERCLY